MKKSGKIEEYLSIYQSRISNGDFGESGDRFITTRDIVKDADISHVYASRLIRRLCEEHYLMLIGKHYYLTYGTVHRNTPLYRILIGQKPFRFSFILMQINNPYFSSLAQNLSEVVSSYGDELIIQYAETPAMVDILLHSMRDRGVSGVFLGPGCEASSPEIIRLYPLPIVSVGSDLTDLSRSSTLVDNYTAGRNAAKHLLDIHCDMIAYIGFEGDEKQDLRFIGFSDYLKMYGIVLDNNSIIRVSGSTLNDGKIYGINHILKYSFHNKKIGFFCFHDILAAHLLQKVYDFNKTNNVHLTFPEDIAVIGFDNLMLSEHTYPKLTTFAYNLDRMAELSYQLMMNQISGTDYVTEKKEVSFSMIIRESTDKCINQ